jgi:hypothetical protein
MRNIASLRILVAIDLVLVLLIFALSFAHVLELPGKLQLDGPQWLMVQQHLYVAFGPFASVAEPLGIGLAWAVVFRLRRVPIAFRPVLLAAIATTVGLAVWFAVVSPMNGLLNGWTGESLPAGWTACRNQWEAGHAAHAVLFAIGVCALFRAAMRLSVGGDMDAKRPAESG